MALKLCQSARKSGTLVLPKSTTPAPSRRSTATAFFVATFFWYAGTSRVVVRLLDRHGHAVQRAPDGAPGQRTIGRAGARARAVEVADDEGVQRAVVLLDAREVEVEQLEAADLLLPDVGGELPRGAERDVEHRGASCAVFARREYTPSGRPGNPMMTSGRRPARPRCRAS